MGALGYDRALASGEVRQRHMWELAQSASEGVRCRHGPDASMGRAGEEHGHRHGLDVRLGMKSVQIGRGNTLTTFVFVF
jgi:hypothetical protein